ncbi:MAG: endonuclease/exonuclease/phosphatase family protein, partial [Planctomycetota bacterium]
GGEYGEAILSRLPIHKIWNHPLPYRVGQEPRTALAVDVGPDDGLPEFLFVSTHLCHQSDATRSEQTQQLNRIFGGQGGRPVVLAGDLNARPNSAPMRELFDAGWIDAVAPQSRIDYVLFRERDPWKVRKVVIFPDDVTSDHRPVLVVLEWSAD